MYRIFGYFAPNGAELIPLIGGIVITIFDFFTLRDSVTDHLENGFLCRYSVDEMQMPFKKHGG